MKNLIYLTRAQNRALTALELCTLFALVIGTSSLLEVAQSLLGYPDMLQVALIIGSAILNVEAVSSAGVRIRGIG